MNLPEQLRRTVGDDGFLRVGARVEDNSGRDLYRMFAPQFAYGRHRGPLPKYAHSAAVLIALIPSADGGWEIPLTLRPSEMLDHAGQVSLPGGRAESHETPWVTACREFNEELGCCTDRLLPVGKLKPLYVYASRHHVRPVIASIAERPVFQPNPEEVAELLFLKLEDLLLRDAMSIGTMQRGKSEFEAPGFRVGEYFVWGATAMILGEFRQIVRNHLQLGIQG